MSGHLIYIVGASGAGKDSILSQCRSQLIELNTGIAHRYITRPASATGENHIALSTSEFGCRKNRQLFKFDWQANGFHYAIGCEVDAWLASGLNVIVNGSRGYLSRAQQLHRQLTVIYIDVDTDCLRERLLARGRESNAAIEQRLNRHQQLAKETVADAYRINNSGDLNSACDELLALIRNLGGSFASQL
ncbi:MAG: hypothetical protein OFPII_29690 [Osedax symbiont Rs1]|nr:MAG: hypothetical protein OFPII_29690 [Osedax symbiont Rs1]